MPCRFLGLVGLFAFIAPAMAGSSNSLMDISPDGTRLIVANSDNGTVTVIDTAKHEKLREIAVGDKPEGVTWIGNGPLAAVTIYHDDRIALIDTESGKTMQTLDVDDEPYGIVSDKAGKRAWVTHDYPGVVSEIDLLTRKVIRKMPAGKFIRGIALSPDESRIYVTEFFTARMHAIDLASGKVVDTWNALASDNLCRNVVLHPKRPKAYLSHTRSNVNFVSARGAIAPQLTVFDLVQPVDTTVKHASRRKSFAMDTYNGVYVVTNPWEAAISSDGKHLYTIYAGTDDMNVSTVIDDDYKEIERAGYAVQLGKNPRAIRVSPDSKSVYVYNALDFSVSFYSAEMRPQGSVTTCSPPKSPEWLRGKILFNSSKQPMGNARWVSCSSCHPDGGHDGRVWHNPEGLRRTTGFWGMAHTHPIHWSADRDEVQDFEYTIRGPLMSGRGLCNLKLKPKKVNEPTELGVHLSDASKDLDALAIYANSFDFTLSPHIPAAGKLSAEAERGKKLFFSTETKCASCHSGPYYSDSNLSKRIVHDVGTGKLDPGEKMGPNYDTPTLLGAYRLTSYLHHGKAASLREVLTKFNPEDKHGETSQLKKDEIDDLVEFLRSLPYELPPGVTPNTVKYRFTK
jgi:YVTN family beta-propeller protein